MSHANDICPVAIPFEIPLPNGQRLARMVWCYFITGNEAALIDAGVAGAWPSMREAMDTCGIASGTVRHLLFTHAHPDHIGAAQSVLRETGARTHAHRDAVRWIEDTDLQNRERPVPGFDTLVEGPVRIDHEVADGQTFALGSLHLHAVATPGHAGGHLAFHCPEMAALFSGDALPEPHAMPIYTDLAKTLSSLHRLQALEPVTTLYSSWEKPIRGREAIDARFVAAWRWLQDVHEAVRAAAAEPGDDDLTAITRRTMARLGLAATAANPLTAATVKAHQTYADCARVCELPGAVRVPDQVQANGRPSRSRNETMGAS